MLYDNYIKNLSDKIARRFNEIEAEHNFDLGDEFEVALCQILRDFLPLKYGICRGFVVDSASTKEGDDIIIFDQERFPTLRILQKDNFAIKEQIPIEAVYAYIECKHTLTEDAFKKAILQVCNVKKLCSTREIQKLYQLDPYVDSNLQLPQPVPHLPSIRNPVFGLIFSRYAIQNKTVDPVEIDLFLRDRLNEQTKENYPFFPELIIAGNFNFLSTCYRENDINKPTIFHLFDKAESGYQFIKTDGFSFGIAFAHLIAALDWIRLGRMPWENIINESKEVGHQNLNLPFNSNLNNVIEISFDTTEDFVNGSYTYRHDKGYTPQVSVLTEDGEEVITDIKKNKELVTVSVSEHIKFKGKIIIS